MRLRTCNKRKARILRATDAGQYKTKRFCYILHEAPYVFMKEVPELSHYKYDLVQARPKTSDLINWRFVSRSYCYDIKQQFPSYADAIVWLTKIKLSLMDKPEKYRLFKLAKIVEGYYTRGKRENVTRVTDLTNVSHSLPTRQERLAAKRRQQGQQWCNSLRYAKAVAGPTSTTTSTSSVRSDWTTTGSSSTQTVGGRWNGPATVSGSEWGTVNWSN